MKAISTLKVYKCALVTLLQRYEGQYEIDQDSITATGKPDIIEKQEWKGLKHKSKNCKEPYKKKQQPHGITDIS